MPVTCCYCDDPIVLGQEATTSEGLMHQWCAEEWAGEDPVGDEAEDESRFYWD